MQETWETRVQSLGREDPLEKEMATCSSILAWRIAMDRGAWQPAYSPWGHNELYMTEHAHTGFLRSECQPWLRSCLTWPVRWPGQRQKWNCGPPTAPAPQFGPWRATEGSGHWWPVLGVGCVEETLQWSGIWALHGAGETGGCGQRLGCGRCCVSLCPSLRWTS